MRLGAYKVREGTGTFVQTELVHDPVGLLAVRSSAFVKHECLAHSDDMLGVDGLVSPCGFPEPGCCCTVCTVACGVLLILVAEEVPVVLVLGCVVTDPAHLCEEEENPSVPTNLPTN